MEGVRAEALGQTKLALDDLVNQLYAGQDPPGAWKQNSRRWSRTFTHLGEEDFRLYKAMKRWHNEVGDMLAYVNDVSRRR